MWILFLRMGLRGSGCRSQVIAWALGELLELWASISEQNQRQHCRRSLTSPCMLAGTALLHRVSQLLVVPPSWKHGCGR